MLFQQIIELKQNKPNNQKTPKNLNLVKELKKLWKGKITVKLIIVGTLGIISKNLEKRIQNWKELGLSKPQHLLESRLGSLVMVSQSV